MNMGKKQGSVGLILILASLACTGRWGISPPAYGSTLMASAAQTPQPTQRINFAQARRQTTEVVVYVNRSSVIQFDQALARVSLAQPGVAEAIIISPTQVLVNGRAIGTSSFVAWSTEDPERPVALTLRVVADIEPILAQIPALFPNEKIKVEQVDGRVILSGEISSPPVGEAVLRLFEGTGLRPLNLLKVPTVVTAPRQVLLQVRVAEVNRQIMRELGASLGWLNPLNLRGQNEAIVGPQTFNAPFRNFIDRSGPETNFSDMVNLWAFSPSISLYTFIRALQQRNAFRSLAEPNIIALDGQEASFLAGGEFPFAVVQPSAAGLSVTIQFKEFGVRLKFKPEIVGDNRIRLHLEPEVSALDFANALELSGFRVPSLRARRASTTVELGDGQAFALAGLLSNDVTRVSAKVPLLGDIPILGYLFRSASYLKNESELVFLCTVQLVNPVRPEDLPPLPGEGQEEWKKEGLEGRFGHHPPGGQPPKGQ
jgi:pilus assembly protein CpaC